MSAPIGISLAPRAVMPPLYDALAELLSAGPVSARQLAERAGVSRHTAIRELRWRVSAGQLRIEGMGPATRYTSAHEPRPERYWEQPPFWARIQKDCPSFAYVRISEAVGARPARREQARRVLDLLGERDWNVIDFDGVEHASSTFLREILVRDRGAMRSERMMINASLAIRSAVARLDRLEELTPRRD